MIKGKLRLLIAPVLMLGLTACNIDTENAAMDMQNDNQNNMTNRSNIDVNRVNYRTTNTDNHDNNNRFNVFDREGIFADDHDDNLIDHRGPLTENYANRKGGNEYDLASNGNRNGTLSSFSTSKSSRDYPHTRAILIQEAKYKFVPVNENQERRDTRAQRNQARVGIEQPRQEMRRTTKTTPNRQQQAATPAPTGQQQQTATPAPANQQQAKGNINQYARQVVDLTNQQRKKNGLPALQLDTKLSNVAQMKSQDMQKNGYFSHTSPTYGSPFDMMRDFGVSYRTAGENIAQGQRTPQEVVNAWMNSEGHRRNILNRNFTHIGVGYESAGHHWTQMFIGK